MRKGISLTVLVVTIVVLAILTAIVINQVTNRKLVEKAESVTFISDWTTFQNELNTTKGNRQILDYTFNEQSVNATWDGTGNSNIKTWIPSFTENYKDEIEIVNGELVYIGNTASKISVLIDSGYIIIQPQESNVMVVASSNGTGTALGTSTQTSGTTTYISFEANLESGTITSVTYNGTNPATTITVQGNKYVQSITSNGTYSFTINGTVEGSTASKTFTVTVNQYIGEISQPQESNVMVVSASNGIGTALGVGTQTTGTTTYISFEARLEGGTITSVTCNEKRPFTNIVVQGNKYVQPVTSNGTYSFTINGTIGGNTTSKTFTVTVNQYVGDALNAYRYGDKINYNVDLAGSIQSEWHLGNGWKIFYEDLDYLYIIAEDYLCNSRIPNELNMYIDGQYPYNACWDSFNKIGASSINAEKAAKFGLSWLASNQTATNNNIKAVADLFDDSWTEEFGNGITGITCETIGGPTLEMYVNSWNAKGYTRLYCNNSNAYGYNIGTTTGPTTNYIEGLNDGYIDLLYYPHTEYFENCCEYYLASPSAADRYVLMSVQCNVRVGCATCGAPEAGVRPVVSILKSAISLEEVTNRRGEWNVSAR